MASHFGQNKVKNNDFIKKCFEQKLFRIKFSTKNSVERMSLSLFWMEPEASKDCHFLNILLHWNGKVDSFQGWTLQKISKILKNASNNNCSELNFIQNSTNVHLYLLCEWSTGAPKDCHFYNILM